MNTLNSLTSALAPDDHAVGGLFADLDKDEARKVYRGRGCGACAWLGTAEAEELYWETKRQLVRFTNLS